jgi:predicted DNA-binding transcriptional regulator AlpA
LFNVNQSSLPAQAVTVTFRPLSVRLPAASPGKPEGVLLDTTGERLLTTREAAALLGLSARTLEAYRTRGGGPPFRALSPRVVRYHRSDLLVWVDSKTALHTAQARSLSFSRPQTR